MRQAQYTMGSSGASNNLSYDSTSPDSTTPTATVIWWNDKSVCVQCPYCLKQHENPPVWQNGRPLTNHTDSCDFRVCGYEYGLPYRPLYPFEDGHSTPLSWKIDKEVGEFVTVGFAEIPEETDYSEDERSDGYETDEETDKTANGTPATPARPRTGSIQRNMRASTPGVNSLTDETNRLGINDQSELNPEMEEIMSEMERLGAVQAKIRPQNIILQSIAEDRSKPPATPSPPERYRPAAPGTSMTKPPFLTPPMSPESPNGRLASLTESIQLFLETLEDQTARAEALSKTAASTAATLAQNPPRTAPSTPQRPAPARITSYTEARPAAATIDPNSLSLDGLSIDDDTGHGWFSCFDEGIDLLMKNSKKNDRLRYFALIRSSDEFHLRLLLKPSNTADLLDLRDKKGNTGMILASRYGSVDIVKLLHENKKSLRYVNARNIKGRTALMEAALWGQLAVVRHLLSVGADPDVQDAKGRRAVDFAKFSKRNVHERSQRNKQLYERHEKLPEPILNAISAHLKVSKAQSPATSSNKLGYVEETNMSSTSSYFIRYPSSLSSDTFSVTHKQISDNTQLTTYSNIPDSKKVIGRLDRGSLFPVVSALSGYTQTYYARKNKDFLNNSLWTDKAKDLSDKYDMYYPKKISHGMASHVEKQLLAYYIYNHVLLKGEHVNLRSVTPPMDALPMASIVVGDKAEPCEREESCKVFIEQIVRKIRLPIAVTKRVHKMSYAGLKDRNAIETCLIKIGRAK